LTEQAIVIIEWPENFRIRTGWPVVRIHLEHINENTRKISIKDEMQVVSFD
jgi:tRNA A37 threonylcarbamoyladenosine biosynthesis protein TsaE